MSKKPRGFRTYGEVYDLLPQRRLTPWTDADTDRVRDRLLAVHAQRWLGISHARIAQQTRRRHRRDLGRRQLLRKARTARQRKRQ